MWLFVYSKLSITHHLEVTSRHFRRKKTGMSRFGMSRYNVLHFGNQSASLSSFKVRLVCIP